MACPGYYSITRSRIQAPTLPDTKYEGMRPLRPEIRRRHRAAARLLAVPRVVRFQQRAPQLLRQGPHVPVRLTRHGHQLQQKKGAGYTGRTVADNFYIQLMLMLKYATQDSRASAAAPTTRRSTRSSRPRPA
ncbi:MAG: hypothetical protein ACLTYW_00025 [Collinsella sp.]